MHTQCMHACMHCVYLFNLFCFAELYVQVGRGERGLHPADFPPHPRGSVALARDARLTEGLFPMTTPVLLGFERMRRHSVMSPLGRALHQQSCSVELSRGLLLMRDRVAAQAGDAGLSSVEESLRGEDVSSTLVDIAEKICSMRDIVANACIASQQELEVMAQTVGHLTSTVLSGSRCMRIAASSSRSRKRSSSSSTSRDLGFVVTYLLKLCKDYAAYCASVVALIRDLKTLADKYKTAKKSNKGDTERCTLPSVNLTLLNNPNQTCK